METTPNTLRSSAENARKEEQAGVRLYHLAVPHSRTLPVRWLMVKATLASSEANV